MTDFTVQSSPVSGTYGIGRTNQGNENAQAPADGQRAQVGTSEINPMGNRVDLTQRGDQFTNAALTAITGGDDQGIRNAISYVLGIPGDSEIAQNMDIATATSDHALNYIMHQDKFYRDEVGSRIAFLQQELPGEVEELASLNKELKDPNLSPDEKKAKAEHLEKLVNICFETNELNQVCDLIQELRDNIKANNFFKKHGDENVAIPRGRMNVDRLEDDETKTLVAEQRRGGMGYNENNPEYVPHNNHMGKKVNIADPELATKDIFNELGIPYLGGASGSTIDFVGILADQLLKAGDATIDDNKLVIEDESKKNELEKKVFAFMIGMVKGGHHTLVEMVYAAKQYGLFENLHDPISSFMVIQEAALPAYAAKHNGEQGADEALALILDQVTTHEDFIAGLQSYAESQWGLSIVLPVAHQQETTGSRVN